MKKVMHAALLIAVMLFASCTNYSWYPFPWVDQNQSGGGHVHSFDIAWTYDETGHWHAATCGHDVQSGFASHTFETRIDATADTVKTYQACTVCGYATEPVDVSDTEIVCQATMDGTQYKTIEEAITAWNEITAAGEHIITISNGRYILQDVEIKQIVNSKGLTIQAATKGGVMISAGEGATAHAADEDWGIFKIVSDSRYNDESPITFKNIDFELLNSDGRNLCAVYCSGDTAERYTGNIIMSGCTFIGLPDETYAIQGGSGSGNRNITIENCYAENLRGYYQGVATPLTIIDSELKDCKSILNRQNPMTPKADGSYDITLRNVNGNIMFADPDSIYAIRTDGGRMLIEDCNIVFDFKSAADDNEMNGLVVLRNGTHEVEIKNSTLTANTLEGSGGTAYAIYSPSGTVTSITVDSASTLTGGVYPTTLLD